MASLALDSTQDSTQDPASYFYNQFVWQKISPDGEHPSGLILRTIHKQFGNWCVKKGFSVGNDDLTKLFWFKEIISYLCHKVPCIKVLNGHTSYVSSVMKLDDTTIVSGSKDTTLRVWDLTDDTSRVLTGHPHDVTSVIKLNDTTIVSASCDGTLRVWDLTYDTSRVLEGHTNNVTSMIKLNDTTIVSGSMDKTVRAWPFATGLPHTPVDNIFEDPSYFTSWIVQDIFEDPSYFTSWIVQDIFEDRSYFPPCVTSVMKLNDYMIVSGGENGTLLFRSLKGGIDKKILHGHTGSVWSIMKLNETTIVSGGQDNTLRVWNLAGQFIDDDIIYELDITYVTSRVLKGHTGSVTSVIKLNETTIVSASCDGTLRVWNLTNNTSRVLEGHTDWVYSVMKLSETMVVSGSADNTVRVWDLKQFL
jgi:WD40 repeat protein